MDDQVNLGTCGVTQSDSTCVMNVAPVNLRWARGWLSTAAFATTTTDYVGPGQVAWFTYRVAPDSEIATKSRDYEFPGDLVRAKMGELLLREGY